MTTPPRPRRPAAPARPRRSGIGGSGSQSKPSSSSARLADSRTRASAVDVPSERPAHEPETTVNKGALARRKQPQDRRQAVRASDQKEPSGAPEVLRTMKELRRPTGQADAVELLGSSHHEQAGTNVARIDELIRARKRGHLRTILRAVLAVLLAGFAIWVAFFSALFALNPQNISVTGGNERFTDDQAQSILAQHSNTPITRLSMTALAGELQASEQVKEATVQRDWPTGLSATLLMREPVVVEQTANGYVLLDREAVGLATLREQPERLPLVKLPTDETLRVTAVSDIEYVAGALPEHIRESVTMWNFETHRVSFELVDGRRIVWGTREDSELKSKTLALLLDQRSARVYDVSSPTKPTTANE